MKFTVLETIQRTSKGGKPYVQAACKANVCSADVPAPEEVPGIFLW